jgi:hypothetical protein
MSKLRILGTMSVQGASPVLPAHSQVAMAEPVRTSAAEETVKATLASIRRAIGTGSGQQGRDLSWRSSPRCSNADVLAIGGG